MNSSNTPHPISSSIGSFHHDPQNPNPNFQQQDPPLPPKKKRSLPGTPDPEAEVVALSPRSLMATNRFMCEVCGKGFQRDQNLQLHRRGHNLPWKLRQRSGKEVRKKVYVCPVDTCVHHVPARALGDLTGIKKHYSRKHGEKKWKCHRCLKKYAVQSDWKAHSKTCGTREYTCDCSTVFTRKDSFVTHRAFCDALMQEATRLSADVVDTNRHLSFEQAAPNNGFHQLILHCQYASEPLLDVEEHKTNASLPLDHQLGMMPLPDPDLLMPEILSMCDSPVPMYSNNQITNDVPSSSSSAMSAAALLQKAAQVGAAASCTSSSLLAGLGGFKGSSRNMMATPFMVGDLPQRPNQVDRNSWCGVDGELGSGFTRDFLGVGGAAEDCLKRSFMSPELVGFGGMCSALEMFGSSHSYGG